MNRTHWLKLALALILPQAAGVIGGLFSASSVSTWYQALLKPSFTPPGWVFAPVWTALFLLMGLAFFLILVSPGDHAARRGAAVLFCAHLAVNTLWSVLFFGLRDPFLAFIDIIILWGMIVFLVGMFWNINRWAGAMLVPYLLWVSFASFLNYAIWRMN